MEVLEFIFQSFWHFAGIVILMGIVAGTLIGIAEQINTKK